MLFSVGSMTYFCFVWLIWAVTSPKKIARSNTIENVNYIGERKHKNIIERHSFGGVLAYLNPSFFPTQFSIDPLKNQDIVREKIINGEKFVREVVENGEYLLKEESFDKYCYVCFLDKANAFNRYCGHGGLCSFCAEELHNFFIGCPICARNITEVVVYENEGDDFQVLRTIRNRG